MNEQDVRWIQRFNHYARALSQLKEAVELAQQRPLSKLEEQGLIQAFEYTYELAWNTLKDYLQSQGETAIHGSRDAFRLAFQRGLIHNGEAWMDMVRSRTLTSHTYNEDTAHQIARLVVEQYFPLYVQLHETLQALKESW
jgi:nucleotidyltransferase substrate binding protein (TIGR01987 family)